MEFSFGDLFSFEKTLATRIIKVVYFIGLIGIVILFLVEIVASFATMGASFLGGLGALIASVIGSAVGVLVWRVVCEAWMALFGIYERLGDIKANTGSTAKGTTGND